MSTLARALTDTRVAAGRLMHSQLISVNMVGLRVLIRWLSQGRDLMLCCNIDRHALTKSNQLLNLSDSEKADAESKHLENASDQFQPLPRFVLTFERLD